MSNTDNEIIPIVDLNDEIIGYKARKDITTEDIYRVSACWIKDESGNILLAQRSLSKKNNPWKRWPAVAGTVAKDETYLQNTIKEIQEQVNIIAWETDLTIWPKRLRDGEHKYFWQWFILTYTGPKRNIKAEEWAVEQLRRYTPIELGEFIKDYPDQCLTSLERCFNNL